ncbi:RND transporter HpnN-like protein [delta proteobacterium NaphS2]|nr:RND transporter HpnN-like protein [delta proteobacterium NaphS2]
MKHPSKKRKYIKLNILWRLVQHHAVAIILTGLAVGLISALGAIYFLHLNSNQDSLVSPSVPFQKRYLEHLKNFGDQEYLFVVIQTGGTKEGKARAAQFAERLNGRLQKYPDLVQAVYYRISPDDLGNGVLLFASPEEARTLTRTISFIALYLDQWFEDGSLTGLFNIMADLLGGEGPTPNKGGVQKTSRVPDMDPALLGKALKFLKDFLVKVDEAVSGKKLDGSLFDLTKGQGDYFFTGSGRLLVMRILPIKDFGVLDVIGKPLAAVRKAIEATRAEFPGLQVGLTGRPALQADEMETTDRDMTRAAVIAVLCIGVLFMIVLHGWLRPFLVLLSLAMATAWTFGFATVTVGELNLLSVIFALVLVGIGVDFGIHVVMRYVEAHGKGLGVEDAVKASLFRTGPGVILGALTSVCAFYSVLGSDFIGLGQLGLIGGTGVIFCLVSMMVVLPAMLLLAGKKKLFPSSAPRITAMPLLERFFKYPKGVIGFLLVLTLLALPGIFKVRFNYNLLELQARGLESVEYERLLVETADESTWYAIISAGTLGQVKTLTKKLMAIPAVGRVESVLDFIPKRQEEKSAQYQEAAAALEMVPDQLPPETPVNPAKIKKGLLHLRTALEDLEEKLFVAGAAQEIALVGKNRDAVDSAIEQLRQYPERIGRLQTLEKSLQHDMVTSLKQLKQWLTAKPVTPKNLPAGLRDLYVGKDGRFQIKVSPKGDIWDFDALGQFVADLRKVAPDVSGVPVGVYESARLMHRTFLQAAILTVLLVCLILWTYSRSMRYVLLAILPLGISMLWLLELMGWLGLDFNLANFFAIPILIAIGVDGGVHFLARWREIEPLLADRPAQSGVGGLFYTGTPTAVALSFTTTMIGFGGLLFAHHRGMASLGAIMVLGSLTGMVACLFALPPILKLVGRFKGRHRD